MLDRLRAPVKEYDIYVPSTHNDGSPIDPAKLSDLKRLLAKRFGGLTYFPQENEGLWRVGKVMFRDKITILRVLAEDAPDADESLSQMKAEIAEEFGQAEVLIVSRQVDLL